MRFIQLRDCATKGYYYGSRELVASLLVVMLCASRLVLQIGLFPFEVRRFSIIPLLESTDFSTETYKYFYGLKQFYYIIIIHNGRTKAGAACEYLIPSCLCELTLC